MKQAWFFLILLFFALIYTTQPVDAASQATVQTDSLNVREEPTREAPVLHTVKAQQSFPVVEEKFGWVKIQLTNGSTGWVAGYLVSTNQSAQTDAPSNQGSIATTGTAAVVTATQLRVRSTPSTEGDILGALFAGEKITVLGEQNGWSQVNYKGHNAYVSSNFLQENGAQPAAIGTAPVTTQPVVDTVATQSYVTSSVEGARVRSAPTTNSSIMLQLNTGDRLPFLRAEGDWFAVETPQKQVGYIANWISRTDSSSESPANVPAPPANRSGGIQGKTIVIDAGHGGRDPGAIGKGSTYEKTVALRTSLMLADRLSSLGANVVLTRSNDTYLTLRERVQISEANAADAFLSLHYDGSDNSLATGVGSFYFDSRGKALAATILPSLSSHTTMTNRGIKEANYHVLRENAQPAVLVELGFMTTPTDEQKIVTASYQANAVAGIVDGLAAYFGE
ncbi:N-acetylmuramoyl-L-alanine amidase [Aureibacillus halotolerans]|uniref:N-acetylmuramoyl-L-alanine amidase n=1 Tax=Aureibacillus halotolerans TaxID=1508390 RepID=A0A4R6TXH1_9BACI|nr:N-acetylmuramoyl-L-alanine amidase [Aureibacillus halotolerans]TDQ37996.1 N-acetylmuramoyl-L-alanine amidase [Aureibacillus halotolerans]